MTSFTSIVALAVLCMSMVTAQHPGVGKCPTPPVQEQFQLASYLGVWYEIARYDVIFEIGSQCNTANYTILPNAHIRVVNTGVKKSSGNLDQAVGEAYNPNPLVGAKIEVKFAGQNFTSKPNYWVVSTDYTQYSMVYSCEQFSELVHFEVVWILGRTPTLSDSLKQEILSRYDSLGISTKPLSFTPQGEAGNCTYNYPNTPKSASSAKTIY